MGYSVADLESIAKELQKDLTGIKTRLSDLQRGIAEIGAQVPDQGDSLLCPHCGLGFNVTTIGQQRLADHIANVHGVSGSGRVEMKESA